MALRQLVDSSEYGDGFGRNKIQLFEQALRIDLGSLRSYREDRLDLRSEVKAYLRLRKGSGFLPRRSRARIRVRFPLS